MSTQLLDSIIERLEQDGPIDLYVSEEEYEHLKRLMRSLWPDSYWTTKERLLVLAFFRGYTFYRELSEHDRAFWLNFHAEIQMRQEMPTPVQYDNLWSAFNAYPHTQNLLQYDGRGRAFVRTIDEAWGIRSLRSQELIKFFITYYQEHPGQRITPTLIQQALPNADEAVLRQAASYDRVFRSMTRAIDFILDNDLEGLTLDELEEHLIASGIDLGQPNALRFFTNKSSHAIVTILSRLRYQRTPRQFQRYLYTVPNHLFLLPDGIRKRASALAQQPNLAFGRYRDLDSDEEHHIAPAARVSLSILENLPEGIYKGVAGLTMYLSPTAFITQVGNRVEASTPIFLRRGQYHLWAGQIQKGVPLCIDGQYHRDTIGWRADTATRLVWIRNDVHLQGEIVIDTFLPNCERDLIVRVADKTFAIHPKGQGQRIVFTLPRAATEAHFEDFATWSWPAQDRLFTSSGREIAQTHLKYGPKTLYLVSEECPHFKSAGTHAERLPTALPLWRITWTGESSLVIGRWRIDAPYRSLSYRLAPAFFRRRDDITVYLHPGFFHANESIEIQLDEELPRGAVLKLQGSTFVPYQGVVRVEKLPPGRYVGEFIYDGEVIAELEPFQVLPSLNWELAQDTILIQGRTQVGRVTLPDGHFETFRWKPRLDENGRLQRIPQRLSFDEGPALGFDIEGACFGAYLVNPQTRQPLSVIRALHSKAVTLQVINPYQRALDVRLRLASEPAATWSVEDLHNLRPTARDHLAVEVCVDKRSDTWIPVTRIPIRLKPVISNFDVAEGFCFIKVAGPQDVELQLEEFEPFSGRTVKQKLPVSIEAVTKVKLCHPEKLKYIHVRATVRAKSDPEGAIILEKVSSPLLNPLAGLRRGLGWSARRRHSRPNGLI